MHDEVSNIDDVGERIVSEIGKGDKIELTVEGTKITGIVEYEVSDSNQSTHDKNLLLKGEDEPPIGVFIDVINSTDGVSHYNIDAYLLENIKDSMRWIGLVTDVRVCSDN